MTVRELIELLQQQDANEPVMLDKDGSHIVDVVRRADFAPHKFGDSHNGGKPYIKLVTTDEANPLRLALQQFGAHSDDCWWKRHPKHHEENCDCGFKEALEL